jgi:hypothetical protein
MWSHISPLHSSLGHTRRHPSGKILTSRTALDDERKQVTEWLTDINGTMDTVV